MRGVPRTFAAFILAAIGLLAAPAAAGAASVPPPDFKVTTNPYTVGQAPDWMPDGEHVVYNDDPRGGGKKQIFVSRLDGSDRSCLTCELAGPNQVPVVQPGGEHILFHSWIGHNLTIGAPGFGGMGSDLWVMNADGSDPMRLTTSMEGHDQFHAYWSPDGSRIVWTSLNWNFITEDGNGKSVIKVARFVDDASGPHLEHIRTVRPANGHWYETQWWAPDGSGFLYTESHGTAINNEVYFCELQPGRMCIPHRLTNDPAWDEQAIFTPDMKKVIFMSTRDHPGAFQDWTTLAVALGLPATYDYALILPVFEVGFLQPIFEQANDLYELTLATGQVRRLTKDGNRGWIIPEFAWDPAGERLLWTESKIDEGVRIDQKLNLLRELSQLVDYVLSGRIFKLNNAGPGDIAVRVVRKTRIGQYVTP